jgi:phosphoglycerate dehydrogenase-like enzyme
MLRVAVLDDYQRRAAGYADWDSLGSNVQVEFFHKPIDADDLASRLAGFDVLVLMRERTRGLFGAAELAQMKPTAALVNTSRGPIVDEAALIAALRDGTIAAAGLDVFDQEPLPAGHPLTELENVVLLPHIGYVSEPAFRHMYGQVVQDVAAFRDGSPIRTLNDR